MTPVPRLLSKTRLMRGYRCLKNIYLNIHDPKLEAPISDDQQALFDQGNAVGAEARKRFPGGVLIDNKPWDFVGSLKRTRELLANKTETIYEAAFEHQGCYARADIIRYSPASKRWTIFEVKSSTKVKPEQIDDIGLQAWIIANSGLPIERICILHLNPECRFPNLENLFFEVDLTATLREKYPLTLPRVREIFGAIAQPSPPAIDIGPHCNEPNECGFIATCWREKGIPAVSIFDLPQLREKKWELYRQGIVDLSDPRLVDLSPLQERIVHTHRAGQRFSNFKGIRESITSWRFPLVFLDFETINPAIPRYPGCRPFSQVPFQFSVHLWASPDSELQHREFLHANADDPRPTLIPALIDACAGEGSIVAYYGKFESDRIKELSDHFPERKAELNALIERIVDPLPVIRENVYDPAFEGSFSLKAVAPAILGKSFSYEGMMVANGTAAQRAFDEHISPEITEERRVALYRGLLEYCRKDTLVMVELVKWLYCQAENVS